MFKNVVLIFLLSTMLIGCKTEGVTSIIKIVAAFFKLEMSNNDSEKKTKSRFNTEQLALLNDINGIWRTDDSELITILIENEKIIFMIDDVPVDAKIGDVDIKNDVVNLNLITTESNEQVTWTFKKKIQDKENNKFTLTMIAHTGEAADLSFVRNISQSDRNRITKIINSAAESMQAQNEDTVYHLEEVPDDNQYYMEDVSNKDAGQAANAAAEQAAATVEAAAMQTAEDVEPVYTPPKPQVNYKTEKLHLYSDVQMNNGMLSVTTNKGFSTWQVNNLSAAAANTLIGLSSGQCFNLVSKKGFNQTDGRDIQSVYQVAC